MTIGKFRVQLTILVVVIGMVVPSAIQAQGFSVSCGESEVTIEYDGKLVTKYHFRDKVAMKTYFWPVIGPKGKSMTRAFPMETVAGEQHDHPHHRGVWFAHQGVAGTDASA